MVLFEVYIFIFVVGLVDRSWLPLDIASVTSRPCDVEVTLTIAVALGVV